MDGQFFETWVVAEIYNSYINEGKQPPLYFYCDSSKTVLSPIGADPSEEAVFSGAAHLKTKIGTGAVICMPADMIPIDEKNWYIPAWLI